MMLYDWNLGATENHRNSPRNKTIVTWSIIERREIRNFPYPSMFELTGHQRLTIKKRNRNVGQFLAAEVTNPGQNESQQMFALCDRMVKERGLMVGHYSKAEVAPFFVSFNFIQQISFNDYLKYFQIPFSFARDSAHLFTATSVFKTDFLIPISADERGCYFCSRILSNHLASFFCQANCSDYYLYYHPVTECKHLLAFILTWICYFGREELTYIPYSSF